MLREFLLLSTIACCTEAKYVEGNLKTDKDWVFLTRFCFLSIRGTLHFILEFPSLDDGSNLHLLLYYDDATQWPSVYKNDSKNCRQKEAVLHPENNQIIYLTEREGWTGCSAPVDGQVHCETSQSFQSSRERWWFVAVSRCGTIQNILLQYKLTMTNGDDFFHRHYSADEFYILEVDIAFLVAVFILFILSIVVAVVLRNRQMFHTTYKLYMVAVSAQLLHLIIMCATYAQYGKDGIENFTAKTFGRMCEATAELVFLLMLILMAKGFTVTRGRISTSGSIKLAVFMTVYVLTYAALFIYQAYVFDPGLVLYLYESPPGYALLGLRLIGWVWFCYAVLITVKRFPKKVKFYIPLYAIYTVWFWANPIAVIIANKAMAPWMREKVANGVFQTMEFCSLAFYLFLTRPSNANKNFPYHIRTTQIDVLPGDSQGGTPLSNSLELDQAARTPDTADGQYFSDLFTISQRQQQRANYNATLSQQQPQQSSFETSQ